MEIADHHILITGANRGIGKAVALAFAQDKAHLHLLTRQTDPVSGAAMKEELLKEGAASVVLYECDLSKREQITQFLQKMESVDIDILFNNAGQLTGGPLETQSLDEIYSLLQVNINALIHLTHGFLPKMLKRKKGKIINHSSVVAVMNFPCSSTYAASKAAVLAFTNSLRAELHGTGVSTLTLVTPGVDTRMFNEIPKLYGAYFDVEFLNGIPSKKYAQMIREAVLEDLQELRPQGLTGIGLRAAQHLPRVFESLMLKRFKRDD